MVSIVLWAVVVVVTGVVVGVIAVGGGSSGSSSSGLDMAVLRVSHIAHVEIVQIARVVSLTQGRREPHLVSPHTAGQVWGCFAIPVVAGCLSGQRACGRGV